LQLTTKRNSKSEIHSKKKKKFYTSKKSRKNNLFFFKMATSGYARWCFKTDNNRFKSMGLAVNRVIEAVYQQSPRPSSFTVTSGGSKYFIDFETMTQLNVDTKYKREVARHYVCATTGNSLPANVAGNSPLLLLPAPSNNTTTNTTNNNNTPAPLLIPANLVIPNPLPPIPDFCSATGKKLTKTAKSRLHAEQMRDVMKKQSQIAFLKIAREVSCLSEEEKGKVLSRVIHKAMKPFPLNKKNAGTQIVKVDKECSKHEEELRKALRGKYQRVFGRKARQQLAMNLARLMIGTTPQW
jgi:hypothetical protein